MPYPSKEGSLRELDAFRLKSISKLFSGGGFYPTTYVAFKREIEDLMPFFDSGNYLVLDVGCGSGQYAQLLNRLGLMCIGLDSSAKALEKAKQKNLLIRASATALPFREGCLDMVICIELLHHLTRTLFNLVLGEIRRTLKNNGLFIFDVKNSLNPFLAIMYKIKDQPYCTLKSRNLFKIRKNLVSWDFYVYRTIGIPYPVLIPNIMKFVAPKVLVTARACKNRSECASHHEDFSTI
jgi:SAM-dependent methyltransferase